MVSKISLLFGFVFVINPLPVFSQNNSQGLDYKARKKEGPSSNPGFVNSWLPKPARRSMQLVVDYFQPVCRRKKE